MIAHQPPRPDWAQAARQPGLDPQKVDKFRADYAAAEARLPKTADEARDQARQAYVTAGACTKAAQRFNVRFRKRRKLIDLAALALSTGQWLLLEEQRLRAVEALHRQPCGQQR